METFVPVRFSLALDSVSPSVKLILTDSGQIAMSPAVSPLASVHVYETTVRLDGVSFPIKCRYNYELAGRPIFPELRTLLIGSPPPSGSVVVSDSPWGAPPPADQFAVNFHVYYAAEPGETVAVQSDFPVFEGARRSYIALSSVPGTDIWSGTALISLFAARPIAYKYSVYSRDGSAVHRENGRCHVLYVGDTFGGFSVSVYDGWTDHIGGFQYIPRPVWASSGRWFLPFFALDFVPRTPVPSATIAASGAFRVGQMMFVGGWRFDALASEGQFEFGIPPTELPSFVVRETTSVSWTIAARFIDGSPFEKTLSVYVPLVSLRTNGKPSGDFGALVEFAEWAKGVGIGQVHVHIEQLADHLLDPVHACVPCDAGELSLPAIREAKLRWLRSAFDRDDPHFCEFCRTFGWVKALCPTDFAQWVQFRLFTELAAAHAILVELGVQLVVDFPAAGNFANLPGPLAALAHCCHAVRLIGMENFAQPLRREVLVGLFGAKAELVAEAMCTSDGLRIPKERTTDEHIRRVAGAIGDPDAERKIRYLVWIVQQEHPAGVRDFLESRAPYLPAAVLLDTATTRFFGAKRVRGEFRMIPGQAEITDGETLALMPQYLSPEMFSEFPLDTTNDLMERQLRDRAGSAAAAVTVYLGDLLAVFGRYKRPMPAPIQLIHGHLRFSLPMSIDEMKQNSETNTRIHDFLTHAGRAV
jgi:hypothetical protein